MHYYQFNIGDYSSHTSRLSIYEDIAYRRLLDLYYLNERPFNGCSTDIAREIGMMDSQDDVDYVLNKFFTEVDGVWINKRCDREINAYHNKQKSAKKAGIASAKARKEKSEQKLNDRSTTVQPNINQEPITNNHKPTTKEKEKKTFILPEWIDDGVWMAFLIHRRKLKAPMTDHAKNLMIKKLEKLNGNPNEILNQSIESGWKGVFEIKQENHNGANQSNNKTSLGERATAAREEFERKNNDQSMGKA